MRVKVNVWQLAQKNQFSSSISLRGSSTLQCLAVRDDKSSSSFTASTPPVESNSLSPRWQGIASFNTPQSLEVSVPTVVRAPTFHLPHPADTNRDRLFHTWTQSPNLQADRRVPMTILPVLISDSFILHSRRPDTVKQGGEQRKEKGEDKKKIQPLHQTLHLAQCSQTSTVYLATTKPRLVHQITGWRSMIRHSRECVCTALESSDGVLYTTASDALPCTWWCMAWMQLLGH